MLAWAAEQRRVLLTRDAATLVRLALARLAAGEAMPGVLVASQAASPTAVIANLAPIDEASEPATATGAWCSCVCAEQAVGVARAHLARISVRR